MRLRVVMRVMTILWFADAGEVFTTGVFFVSGRDLLHSRPAKKGFGHTNAHSKMGRRDHGFWAFRHEDEHLVIPLSSEMLLYFLFCSLSFP